MPVTITADPELPARSRTFTEENVQEVLNLLRGTHASQTDDPETPGEPVKRIGFGEFETASAARSAGNTLNRLLADHGADKKYAVTTRDVNGKTQGVLLNREAKKVTKKETTTGNGSNRPASTRTRTRGK